MKIAIGSDHAGIELKSEIIRKFEPEGIEFMDFGPHSTDSVDYPDYIARTVRSIKNKEADRAIVLCGTGIGASITANKVRGIRASLCFNGYMAEMTRRHNDSNVLVIGSRVTGYEVAMYIVEKWLTTDFEGGRHQRRIDKITKIEEEEGR